MTIWKPNCCHKFQPFVSAFCRGTHFATDIGFPKSTRWRRKSDREGKRSQSPMCDLNRRNTLPKAQFSKNALHESAPNKPVTKSPRARMRAHRQRDNRAQEARPKVNFHSQLRMRAHAHKTKRALNCNFTCNCACAPTAGTAGNHFGQNSASYGPHAFQRKVCTRFERETHFAQKWARRAGEKQALKKAEKR